jgi:hypothetical protein
MNRVVYIAWRVGSPDERGNWSPVGRLEYADDEYCFVYTHGARTLEGFHLFPGMTDLHAVYRTKTLLPMMSNRLLSHSRPEFKAWLAWSGFDPDNPPDPLAILGVTGGIRQTDALEVFPEPSPDAEGRYRTRFFVHGLRHASPEALQRLPSLAAGMTLRLDLEDDNPHDPRAVAVLDDRDGESQRLGYVPRYLARDVRALTAQAGADAIELAVVRVNPQAPLQMRLLCQLTAPWPAEFAPCAGDEFRPMIDSSCPVWVAHSA